ncbi:Folylpolyglutamate synthase [Chlamydiales bacterium STE3]|nr:Folylpolyglutamate synthase [Chlamydiales bacterium STE3]
MTYAKTIHQLFHAKNFGGVKLGLQNIQLLLEKLDHPEKMFKSIHIAGTNGKGSVAHKMAKAYELAGFRVGLFTSPHISCFRERIQINGSLISEEEATRLLQKIFDLQKKLGVSSTFFELTTLLGFLYFAEQKADVAVIETGLGGRLDATNVIVPEVSIITSIALDHTEILGNSIEEITLEKAGIIKENIPIVIGPTVPKSLIEPIARQKKAPLIQVQGSFSSYEEENCAVAKAAMELIDFPLQMAQNALKALPPCRFELFSESPPILLDVAHNPAGLIACFKRLKRNYPHTPFHVIIGLSKSKDIAKCLEILLSENPEHIYLVEAKNERGLDVNVLREGCLSMGFSQNKISCYRSIAHAITVAKRNQSDKPLLITGTFFIMGDARKALGLVEPLDPIDLNELSPVREKQT